MVARSDISTRSSVARESYSHAIRTAYKGGFLGKNFRELPLGVRKKVNFQSSHFMTRIGKNQESSKTRSIDFIRHIQDF